MFRKLVIFFVAALCCTSLSAQITHSASGDVDQNAQRILKKASSLFSKGTVSFSVTLINKNTEKKETARQKAQVLYSQGKYRVVADGHTLYCNGVDLWHWDTEAKEVTLSKASTADDDLMNPARLLANYNKSFRAKYIRTEDNGNAVIDLTPRKGKSYHKIRVVVVEKTGTLVCMELHNYDGSRGSYQMSAFKSAQKSTDADFCFDTAKNPDVEVVDMR